MPEKEPTSYTKKLSALNIYQKEENNQLRLEDLDREDMHFKMRTGADILIEENGIHVPNPFKFSVQDVYDWSQKESENFDVVLDNYLKWHKAVKHRYDRDIVPTYKPYFEHDGFQDRTDFKNPDEILVFLRDRIEHLRHNDTSVDAWAEIEHRRKNVFDILYYQGNKNLEDAKLKLYLHDFSLTNTVTVLQSVKEGEQVGKEKRPYYEHQQRQYTLGECIEMMSSATINQRNKTARPLVMPNTTGRRIVGEDVYGHWSGLQIFDIDTKFSPSFLENYKDASEIRDILFDKLKHYPWLIGITVSASKRGLHIYTKVSRMHHLFVEPEANNKNAKYWYRMSYMQKHAAIAYCIDKFTKVDDIYTNKQVVDTSLARPAQGIAMNYDPEARWNSNFIDLYPVLFYHIPPVADIPVDAWLMLPAIQDKYQSWAYDNAVNDNDNVEVQKQQGQLQIIIDENDTVDGVTAIDMDSLDKGDKYNTRWRLCNTIIYAYGDTEMGRQLCHHILQTKKTGTQGTINSFIRSAVVNRKDADLYTIKQLKRLGLHIGIEEESLAEIANDTVSQLKFTLDTSDYGFRQTQPDINVKLANHEYLGMQMKKMISHMQDFKINVIESAPNTGKTEFFKQLAKTATVCLVIPFTSTIESKIVSDESINELFDVYYGDKSIKDMRKGRSAVMTFDKFSMMSKSKYSMFKFIAVDESHLLFTSTYRLPVVSQTIENIRTYLHEDMNEVKNALSSVMSVQSLMSFVKEPTIQKATTKFILMSGTLTGEIDYFKFYQLLNYIKVRKLHPYKKEAQFILSRSSQTRDIRLFEHIASVIGSGGKIIHPTNKGDAYAKKVVACVEHILGRTVKYEYYKRANADEDFLQAINKDTTVNDIEILFCSDYLSVGIDIKDQGDFNIVFSNDFTAEAIEQFNNRLRSTDINCKIFYDILDQEGLQKPNIINTNQIEYTYNDELKSMIEDEQAIARLQRVIQDKSQYFAVLGELFSKYFVQDFAGNIKYIRSAFEIEQFELQYSTIARSLLYIKTSLQRKYEYTISVKMTEEVTDDEIDVYQSLMKEAKAEHDRIKSESFIELVDFLSQDQVYNAVITGNVKYNKDTDDIPVTDLGLHLGYDPNYLNGSFIITWNKRHKLMLDHAKKFVKKMRKLYAHQTTNSIVESCLKSGGLINKTDIKRYERLMGLLFDDRKHTLSPSTRSILKLAYKYVATNDEKTKLTREDYDNMKLDIKERLQEQFNEMTEYMLKSKRRQEGLQLLVGKFVDTLFHKNVGQEYVTISFRKIFKFDSDLVQQTIKRDKIFHKILLNEEYDKDQYEVNVLSESHLSQDIALIS